MRLLPTARLDLIEPFPVGELPRLWRWLRCFANMTLVDGGPQTADEFVAAMTPRLLTMRSFGLIDRDNALQTPCPAPIIGAILAEPAGPWNMYFHVASTRRAWGSRMVDEAAAAVVDALFTETPDLLRLSAYIPVNNNPARALARRAGLRSEGTLPDWLMMQGEPRAVAHYGLTRRDWLVLRARPAPAEQLELGDTHALGSDS